MSNLFLTTGQKEEFWQVEFAMDAEKAFIYLIIKNTTAISSCVYCHICSVSQWTSTAQELLCYNERSTLPLYRSPYEHMKSPSMIWPLVPLAYNYVLWLKASLTCKVSATHDAFHWRCQKLTQGTHTCKTMSKPFGHSKALNCCLQLKTSLKDFLKNPFIMLKY